MDENIKKEEADRQNNPDGIRIRPESPKDAEGDFAAAAETGRVYDAEANLEQSYGLPMPAVATVSAPPLKPKKKRGWITKFFNVFLICLILLLLFAIIFMNTFILCPVSQESMLPTINDGQRVLLLKTQNVGRGDIFVFQDDEIDSETGKNKNLIKRAMGIGGDKLLFVAFGDQDFYAEVFLYRDMGDGFLQVAEDYLQKEQLYRNKPMVFGRMGAFSSCIFFAPGCEKPEDFNAQEFEGAGYLDRYIIKVPDNSYFAMGDNRNNSRDSRNGVGFVSTEDIIGRYQAKLTPGSFVEKLLRIIYRNAD